MRSGLIAGPRSTSEGIEIPDQPAIDTSIHARAEWHNWVLLCICLTFFGVALAIAPGDNCDSRGNCYPIFVWLARLVGGTFSYGFAMLLFVNPSYGVRYEPQSGDLFWWTSSRGDALLGTGRVHPSQISRIEIDNTGEDTDLRLIGRDNRPIHGFSDKNLPGPCKPWAEKLTRRWPAIELRELK